MYSPCRKDRRIPAESQWDLDEGMQREHAQSERVEKVPPRFCGRNTMEPHAQSVYFFDKDCSLTQISAALFSNTR
ncbi:hypothetical protein Y032_0015g2560 [Ancylostoma ceylanicum]|uniref:Uncharacterized protein n=1 Tax=Ancylostoma ceylanicum TaxID=53326 RepID=A0A016V8C0_9BILA|nr:hypothetical protein Y032_0015g2560 [Ancylostoma ceylanicum]